ncbi:MAG TPA: phosphate/phosphite/phosphonate ABC transporter substrate-binding protein [Rhodopila sp.]
MTVSRRSILLAPPALALVRPAHAEADVLRFGVGPLQPTPGDTRRVYEPFFRYLAEAAGRPFELVATTDWAGIAVALAGGQVDCAWMGPWGYVLAKDRAGAEALAVVDYKGKPVYHAVIIAKPDLPIGHFPEDAKGMSISFADTGSTSGWLIPSYWFKSQGIDPKAYFNYRDGATHAANDIAVANGQVDLATDFDRNLNAMIAAGRIKPDQVKIVWKSDPLPNDALAVRKDLDPHLKQLILKTALGIDAAKAAEVMPANYTGWERAEPDTYTSIEDAGRALGRSGR